MSNFGYNHMIIMRNILSDPLLNDPEARKVKQALAGFVIKNIAEAIKAFPDPKEQIAFLTDVANHASRDSEKLALNIWRNGLVRLPDQEARFQALDYAVSTTSPETLFGEHVRAQQLVYAHAHAQDVYKEGLNWHRRMPWKFPEPEPVPPLSKWARSSNSGPSGTQ